MILLNFDILGEMDTASAKTDLAKPVQNENIEPQPAAVKTLNMDSKSFFNKKETEKKHSGGSNDPPGMFNGYKIHGISSLNPYQNK